jgi:hypothetical protein
MSSLLNKFRLVDMPRRASEPPVEPPFPGAVEPLGGGNHDVRSFRFSTLARALGGRIDGEDLTDWDLSVLRWIDARLTQIQATQGEMAARVAMDLVIEILKEGGDEFDLR